MPVFVIAVSCVVIVVVLMVRKLVFLMPVFVAVIEVFVIFSVPALSTPLTELMSIPLSSSSASAAFVI